jgi:membrane protein YqaA with SNARE-associated domain
MAVLQKLFVGSLLLKAYNDGIVRAPIGMAGLIDWTMAAMLAAHAKGVVLPDFGGINGSLSVVADKVLSLRRFVKHGWFPLLVGTLSCANTFVLVLSGPLAALFVLQAAARPERRFLAAAINAAGTTLGAALLLALVERMGGDWVETTFPRLARSDEWELTAQMTREYGFSGIVAVSSLPVVLHPLVLFASAARVPPARLLTGIAVGRTLKYSIMAQLAVQAPSMLRAFGVVPGTVVGLSGKKRAE